MNDTLADVVFLERRLREAELNLWSSRQPLPASRRPARARLATLLVTLAAWLAPANEPHGRPAQTSIA